MNRAEIENRIVRHSEIMLGKPVIRGTRIPVYLIRDLVAAGMTAGEIVDDYPDLTIRDVEAAMAYVELNPETVEPILQSVS
jgi:uncharacterized protein (DUF433 family)